MLSRTQLATMLVTERLRGLFMGLPNGKMAERVFWHLFRACSCPELSITMQHGKHTKHKCRLSEQIR